MEIKGQPDCFFSFRPRNISNAKILDAWAVREEFLGVKNPVAALDFLNKTGRFILYSLKDELHNFSEWQELIRQLIKTKPKDWEKPCTSYSSDMWRIVKYSQKYGFDFDYRDLHPHGTVFAGLTLTAILATVHIDHLRGAKFKFCARKDCGRPYEITSRHRRKFCSMYCAHFTGVRRSRAKKKKSLSRIRG